MEEMSFIFIAVSGRWWACDIKSSKEGSKFCQIGATDGRRTAATRRARSELSNVEGDG